MPAVFCAAASHIPSEFSLCPFCRGSAVFAQRGEWGRFCHREYGSLVKYLRLKSNREEEDLDLLHFYFVRLEAGWPLGKLEGAATPGHFRSLSPMTVVLSHVFPVNQKVAGALASLL